MSVEEEVKRVLALDDDEAHLQSHGCVKCNCKKSRCLKLYCDCFAAGVPCSDCNCEVCENIAHSSAR